METLIKGKGKRILVTGSSGFLGSSLSQKLSYDGHDVLGIDTIFPSKKRKEILENEKKFVFKRVDITKAEQVATLFKDYAFDLVFHLAAVANPRTCKENFDLAFNVNVVGTKNLLIFSNKCNQLIFMSSASVYGEPLWLPIDENHPKNGSDPYSITKILGENLCLHFTKNNGRNISIARNFNSFGVGQSDGYIVPTLIRQALNHKIEVWNSNTIRDLTYVDNTVNALILISSRTGMSPDTYNIGSGIGIQIGKLANLIKDSIDECIEIEDLQKPVLGSRRLVADNRKLRVLGWHEKVSLNAGIHRTIEWLKSQ